MGRVSLDGPVFGAHQVLAQWVRGTAPALSQTDLEWYEVAVPADEDWYVTRVRAYAVVAGTAAATVDVEDDGTSILTGNITLVAAGDAAGTLTTPAGTRIAASSVVTFDVTTGATTAPSDFGVRVEGWKRFVGAPRGVLNPLA